VEVSFEEILANFLGKEEGKEEKRKSPFGNEIVGVHSRRMKFCGEGGGKREKSIFTTREGKRRAISHAIGTS